MTARRALVVVAICGCNSNAPAPERDRPAIPRDAAPKPSAAIAGGSVAVDGGRACAIEPTGKVACWGRGSAKPVEVPELADAVGLAAGPSATCAWTARGKAICWGDAPSERSAPELDGVVQVSVGGDSACALGPKGRVACWPTAGGGARAVPGLADAVEIAGAYSFGAELLCARLRSGDVTCGNQVRPFAVIPELAGATSLAGAGARFAALLPGHRLATWLGWTGSPMPRIVDGVDGERVIAGGHLNGVAAICVLGTRSRCWSWSKEPERLSELAALPANVRDLALDTEATCARIVDRVECWGRSGRLGNGDPEYPPDFVPVDGVADARQLEAAGRTTCALRASGRVACWGERLAGDPGAEPAIDSTPVELPGVSDAVEIAMESGARSDGTADAIAVCARRAHGATCWTRPHDELVPADAPELAAAVELYSGPAVCGVAAGGPVRCVRPSDDGGPIAAFSEDDYEKFVYRGSASGAGRRIARELEKRLHAALAAKRSLAGFHAADGSDPIGPTGPAFQPPVAKQTGVVQLRRTQWTVDWNEEVRGAVCVRHGDGVVACWGERDYLGAGQRMARADPVPVALDLR